MVINDKLDSILAKENAMAVSLDALKASVAKLETAEAATKALLTGLTQKIQDLINASQNTVDPVALQAIVDQVNADADSLSAAVAANTPAAP